MNHTCKKASPRSAILFQLDFVLGGRKARSTHIPRSAKSTYGLPGFRRKKRDGLAVPLSDCAAHFFASSVSANSQHKSELLPPAVIIGLVDAHSIRKQANDKCDGSDGSMPESAPKPAGSAPRSLYLEFHPATKRAFGMEGCKYIKGTPSRATDVCQCSGTPRLPSLLSRSPRCLPLWAPGIHGMSDLGSIHGRTSPGVVDENGATILG